MDNSQQATGPLKQYQQILKDIDKTAEKCGRNPQDVHLIAVSKGYPAEDVQVVYDAGCRNFGESRVQEALPKINNSPQDIHWHLIGSLQKNKVPKVVGLFDLIHSVNSLELAQKISECSLEKDLITPILLQVNTSGEMTKQGLSDDQLLTTFKQFQELPGIRIEGLMTLAPLTEDADLIRHCFKRLRMLRDELGLHHLSMGMSHDYHIAIEEGATLLRIGTSIFEKNP